MKLMRSFAITFIFLAILLPGQAGAEKQPRLFLDGVQSYHDGNFSQAIALFTRLTDAGILNGELFYNLGNACLKNDDLGHAVLWYARAARLIPGDPDLKFNYNHALRLVKDKSENKNSGIFRILFFWNYMLGRTTIQWIAIVLNLFFWFFTGLQLVKKSRTLHRSTLALVPFLLIFSITAFYHFYESTHGTQAIVLDREVSVRSGFADNSTELFVLHAGTRVAVEKKSKDFLKVCFSDDKIGWIKVKDAGLI
ncbi:MAG: hypothetical protein JRE58_07965 [Deltaproteobacteria bacterium]|nr:hypothetical protein [Deltaproteobacteria bacterium]